MNQSIALGHAELTSSHQVTKQLEEHHRLVHTYLADLGTHRHTDTYIAVYIAYRVILHLGLHPGPKLDQHCRASTPQPPSSDLGAFRAGLRREENVKMEHVTPLGRDRSMVLFR